MKEPIISLELYLIVLIVLLLSAARSRAIDTLTFSTAITAPKLTISGANTSVITNSTAASGASLLFNTSAAGGLISPGVITVTNGVGSITTTAGVSLVATGITNTMGINATAYVTATAVAFTIQNRAQATIYTSPTLTATISVHLQPGWSVNAASGLAGTLLPD